MNPRKLVAIPIGLVAAAGLALTACSVEAGLTVPADELAEQAAGALEKETGSKPDLDCGDDDIILNEGKEVPCTLTDPVTDTQYDTTVTITKVDGTKYEINVQVADKPEGSTDDSAEEPASPGDDGQMTPGLQIAGADLASATADALEEQVGQRPIIDCGSDEVTIAVGHQTYCDLIDGADTYEVTLTITGIDGTNFDFDVAVADEPK